MNNEIEKGLECIFKTLTAKSDKEVSDLLIETMNYINESKMKLDNPDRFNVFINHKLKRGIELIANTLHEPSICRDKNKPNFIYANYRFLEGHIRQLCILKEGSSCCADKSSYILKMYLKYSINGEIPNLNLDLEKYWKPKFGNNELWMEYCDSLYALYYGRTEKYFKAYKELIQCEVRKFKHILHKWYIEFKDGDVIEFDQSLDNRIENPLEYDDKGDFYIMHKRKVKNKNFETYVPTDEEEIMLFGTNYVKIPKSEIVQIFKKSEDIML